MSRIKYTCKNCGWTTSVVSQWADLKPKRCMNAKCNTSFVRESENLVIDDPSRKPKKVKTKVEFAATKKITPKVEDVKSVHKPKSSSKAKQQQAEKKDSI